MCEFAQFFSISVYSTIYYQLSTVNYIPTSGASRHQRIGISRAGR